MVTRMMISSKIVLNWQKRECKELKNISKLIEAIDEGSIYGTNLFTQSTILAMSAIQSDCRLVEFLIESSNKLGETK